MHIPKHGENGYLEMDWHPTTHHYATLTKGGGKWRVTCKTNPHLSREFDHEPTPQDIGSLGHDCPFTHVIKGS